MSKQTWVRKGQVGQAGGAGQFAAKQFSAADFGTLSTEQEASITPVLSSAQLARITSSPAQLAVLARQDAATMHQVVLNPRADALTLNGIANDTTAEATQLALLARHELSGVAVNRFARYNDAAVRSAARRRPEYRPETLRERAVQVLDRLLHGK